MTRGDRATPRGTADRAGRPASRRTAENSAGTAFGALLLLCSFAEPAAAQIFRKDQPAAPAGKTSPPPQLLRTTEVRLDLRTGGLLTGLAVDHNAAAVVVVVERTPYAIAWSEVKTQSAFNAMRTLHSMRRGADNLNAEDHFELGVFALSRGRSDLSDGQFRAARHLDPDLEPRIRDAVSRMKDQRRRAAAKTDELDDTTDEEPGSVTAGSGGSMSDRVVTGLGKAGSRAPGDELPPHVREEVMAVYRGFGDAVREHIHKDLALIETDHFMIWTDWEPQSHSRLEQWCEAMYAALCRQFGIELTQQVFLAKCPVFCWRHGGRFRKFGRMFDEYDGKGAVGYTRSNEDTGHVHMVLLRQGRGADDYDRFAGTLVHEGTHAFLHRLYTTRLIPHWVNEGYAELMAQRVLGDRCDNDAKAELLARQVVRYDWPVAGVLTSTGPIEVHHYPLAHSLVSHLEGKGPGRLAGFIKRLKEGEPAADALARSYAGLTLSGLESGWREAVRRADPESGR